MEENKGIFDIGNLEEDTDDVSSNGFSLSFDDLTEDTNSEDLKDIKESDKISHIKIDGSDDTIPVVDGTVINTEGESLFDLGSLEEDDNNSTSDLGFSFLDLQEDSDLEFHEDSDLNLNGDFNSEDTGELFTLELDDNFTSSTLTDLKEDTSDDISITDYLPSELLDSFMSSAVVEEEEETAFNGITDEGVLSAFAEDMESYSGIVSFCESTSAVSSSKRPPKSTDGSETIMDKFYTGAYQILGNIVDEAYAYGLQDGSRTGVDILKEIKKGLYTINLVTEPHFTSDELLRTINGQDNRIDMFDATEVVQYLQATVDGKKANINTYKFKVRHDKGLSFTLPTDKLFDVAILQGLVEPVPGVSEDRPVNERFKIVRYTKDLVQPFTDLSISDFISDGEYELLFKSLTTSIRKQIELEQESMATKQLDDSSKIKKERDLAYTDSSIFKDYLDMLKGKGGSTEASRESVLNDFTLFKDIDLDNKTFTCGCCGAKNVPFTGGLYEVKKLLALVNTNDVLGFSIPKRCSCGKYNLLPVKVQNSLLEYGRRFLAVGTLNTMIDKIGGVALTLELPVATVKQCLGANTADDELAFDLDSDDKAVSSTVASRKEFFFNHLDALENYKNLKNYYKSYALDSTTLTAGILDKSENFTGNVLLDNILSKKKRVAKLSKTEQLVLDYAKGIKLSDADKEAVDNYRTSNGDVLETSNDFLSKDLKQLAMYICELTGTVYSEIKQQALDTLLTTLKAFRLDSKLNYVAYTQSLIYKSALPYLRGLDVSSDDTLRILTFYTSRTNVAVLSSKVKDGYIAKDYLLTVVDKIEKTLNTTIDSYDEALKFVKDNYDRFTFIPIQGSTEIDMDVNGDILSTGEVKDLLYFVADKMIVLAKAVDLFKILSTKQFGAQAVDLSKDLPSIYRRFIEAIKENKYKFTDRMIDSVKSRINNNVSKIVDGSLESNNSLVDFNGKLSQLYNLPLSGEICNKLFAFNNGNLAVMKPVEQKDIKSLSTDDTVTSTLKFLFKNRTLRALNISTNVITEIKVILKHFMDGNYIAYVNSITKLKQLVEKEIQSSSSTLHEFYYLYNAVHNGLDTIDLDTPSSYVLKGLFEAVTYLDYNETIERTPLNRLYYLLGGQFEQEEIYIYLEEISRKSKFITDRLYKKLPGQTPLDYINNYKITNRQYILSYFKDIILNSEDRVLAEKIILDYFDNYGFLVGYFDIPLEESIPVKSLNDYLISHYIPNTLLMTYKTNKFINKLYTEDYKYIMKMKILSDMSDFAIRHDDTIILSKVMFDIIYVMENFTDMSLLDFLKLDRFNIDRINNDVKDFSLNTDTLESICDVLLNIYYNDNTLDLNIILDSEFKRMSTGFKALALAFTQEESDGEIRVLLDKSEILKMIGFEDARVTEGIDKVFSILEEHDDDLKGFIASL